MATEAVGWTLEEIAQVLGGTVRGDGTGRICRPVPAGSTDPQGITFAEAPKFFALIQGSGVGCALVDATSPELDVPTIEVVSPRKAFGMVLAMFQRPLPIAPGVHPTAVIDDTASIDPSASIGAYVVIGPNCSVARGAQIHAHCTLGDSCSVGELTILMPGVHVIQDVQIGARCLIHSGTVLGADGFGFSFEGGKHNKIPQVGGVIIGDNVEMGANCAVDRATSGNTVVGSGCKFDNYVHVGHNCQIGQHCVAAGVAAFGGSVTVGDYVVIGGGSMLKDHITVASGTQFGGHTLVTSTISERGEFWGHLCLPVRKALKTQIIERQLPELLDRIRELESEVKKLRGHE